MKKDVLELFQEFLKQGVILQAQPSCKCNCKCKCESKEEANNSERKQVVIVISDPQDDDKLNKVLNEAKELNGQYVLTQIQGEKAAILDTGDFMIQAEDVKAITNTTLDLLKVTDDVFNKRNFDKIKKLQSFKTKYMEQQLSGFVLQMGCLEEMKNDKSGDNGDYIDALKDLHAHFVFQSKMDLGDDEMKEVEELLDITAELLSVL